MYKLSKIVCNYDLTYEEIEKEIKDIRREERGEEERGREGGRKKEGKKGGRKMEGREGRKKGKKERERISLIRADLSSILFRNPVLTASYVHLQYSVIEQCDGSKLLLNGKGR